MKTIKKIIGENETSLSDYFYEHILIPESQECGKLFDEFQEYIQNDLGINEKQQDKLMEYIGCYDVQREKDGFKAGLQMGIQMMVENL